MVEIEITEKPKKLAKVVTKCPKSTSPDAKDWGSDTCPESGDSAESTQSCESSSENKSNILTDKLNPADLEEGDVFYGTAAHQGKNNKNTKSQGIFMVLKAEKTGKNKSKVFTIQDICGNIFKSNQGGIHIIKIEKEQKRQQTEQKALEHFGKEETRKKFLEKKQKDAEKQQEEIKKEKELKKIQFKFNSLTAEEKLNKLISSGMNNIWMVGPAGCGKSTMARNVAKELDIPYLCISCGIGTSATEFVGYKYPTRESTKFAEYYAKKSIILIDEMTALDPAVAQVLNAALANDEIETTTGLVHRNPECVIIATSNTFGNGADRQYVANNQLDSSTIDRFVGGIIEVDYSSEYESKFDSEVLHYVWNLRKCIKQNALRRIASTRMIQAANRMKNIGIQDWKDLVIINWSESEKAIVKKFFTDLENKTNKERIAESANELKSFISSLGDDDFEIEYDFEDAA